jgi:hypothetical protein
VGVVGYVRRGLWAHHGVRLELGLHGLGEREVVDAVDGRVRDDRLAAQLFETQDCEERKTHL